MRLSMTGLKGSDAKEVASSVNAIANEKIKAEKEVNTGKKKTGILVLCQQVIVVFMAKFLTSGSMFFAGGKKKQLHVGKPDDDVDVGGGGYNDYDDYDFM